MAPNIELFCLIVVYNPRNKNKYEFLVELENELEVILNTGGRFVFCGDLNIDILKNSVCSKKYQDLLKFYNLNLKNKKNPTRITGQL